MDILNKDNVCKCGNVDGNPPDHYCCSNANCTKAANGDVFKDVKRNKIPIKAFHLMMDKEDKTKR